MTLTNRRSRFAFTAETAKSILYLLAIAAVMLMILFTRDDFALKAGLGEGMVYGGAAPRLRRLIPKTINLDEARGQFIDDLRKGGGTMTIGATKLFRKYGDSISLIN